MPNEPCPQHPNKADGRSLAYFRNIKLTRAEEILLEKVVAGKPCVIGDKRPDAPDGGDTVHGAFLRFLLLGGDDEAPVHERGVQLKWAAIKGDIDLSYSGDVRPLLLSGCRIDGELIGIGARFKSLNLQGCHIQGINCRNAQITGDVFLKSGFEAEGKVSFPRGDIGGDLDCSGGVFRKALDCGGGKIAGNAFLNENSDAKGKKFVAYGEVNFHNAEIYGQLACDGGAFNNADGTALNCENAKIKGAVLLRNKFAAEGEVRFVGAEINGGFTCGGGRFSTRKAARETADDALCLERAKINGLLSIGPGGSEEQVVINGSLNLNGAHATMIFDDPGSWPVSHALTDQGMRPCVIRLDGFTYERFAGAAPTDARTRKKWLQRQSYRHLLESFRPQPFEQLVKVLRSMGHIHAARNIGYLKERYRLRSFWYSSPHRCYPHAWLWWGVRWFWMEILLGHGYRQHRIFIAAVAVWFGCGYVYDMARQRNMFVPADARLYMNDYLKANCSRHKKPFWNNSRCHLEKRVPEYTVLQPYIYSLDVILPLINLRQEADWQSLHKPFRFKVGGFDYVLKLRILSWQRDLKFRVPSKRLDFPGYVVQAIVWFETIFAWVWGLSLTAFVTGIIKRD